MGGDFYVVEQASITPQLIRSAHQRGRRLYAWTMNGTTAMRSLLRQGVDGVVTDRLERAIPLRDDGL